MMLRRRREAEDREFVEVYEALHAQGNRVAFRILGSRQAAEDACAEGFARAYSRWPQIRDLAHRDAWIIKVISNVALDVVARKPRYAPQRWEGDDEDAVTTRLALVAALQELPPRQREVIVLHHLAGYREQEVATALGISSGTVKTHLKRGMAALRTDLRAEGEGPSLAT